jgi:hypothetical protein
LAKMSRTPFLFVSVIRATSAYPFIHLILPELPQAPDLVHGHVAPLNPDVFHVPLNSEIGRNFIH